MSKTISKVAYNIQMEPSESEECEMPFICSPSRGLYSTVVGCDGRGDVREKRFAVHTRQEVEVSVVFIYSFPHRLFQDFMDIMSEFHGI